MNFTLPDLPIGGDIMFGGMMWSALVTALITFITKYKPMSEQNIQTLKGILSALGYVIITFIVNAPMYTNVVMFVLITLFIFLSSSGVYDVGKTVVPALKSNIDNGDKNRGV